MSQLGLDDEKAAKDMAELRELLSAWRDAKSSARNAVIGWLVFVCALAVSLSVVPSLGIGDRYQTLATLTGRAFLFMRNEELGSTTAVLLLILAVSIVVGSNALARRLGSRA